MPGKAPARRPMPAQAKVPAMKGLAKPLPAKAAAKATEMRGYGKKK